MRCVPWLVLLALLAPPISSAVSYSERHCIDLLATGKDASDRGEWQRVVEATSDFEKECVGIGLPLSAEDVSIVIARQSEALFLLSRFGEALSAAERCRAVHRAPYCLLQNGTALFGLSRHVEARTYLVEAKRLASALIEKSGSEIRIATSEADRKRWSQRRSAYRQNISTADAFLTVIDNAPLRGQMTTGTGIVVTKSGSILTNHHVANGCTSIQVDTAHWSLPGKLLASDPKVDLALLETRTEFSSSASLRLTPPQLGEPIAVVGFPLQGLLSSGGSVQFGHISALQGIGGAAQKMQISAPVQKGNSGGPVLDQSGTLIGVVVEKLDPLEVARMTGDIPQNIGFAIRPEVVQSFLRSRGVPTSAASPGVALSSTDLARAGKELTVLIACRR